MSLVAMLVKSCQCNDGSLPALLGIQQRVHDDQEALHARDECDLRWFPGVTQSLISAANDGPTARLGAACGRTSGTPGNVRRRRPKSASG